MENLEKLFIQIIDKIFISVAEEEISYNSLLFKAAATAKKILSSPTEINSERIKYRGERKKMLEHCLTVAKYIFEEKMSFTEACKKRAADLKINVQSVQQACCLALKLNAANWHKMISGYEEEKANIARHIYLKYPNDKEKISKIFKINL